MSTFFYSIQIFLQIYILTIFLSLSGYLFRKCLINFSHSPRFEEDGIYGFILIGFISVLLNFFIPLNLINNSILFLIITLIGIKLSFFKQNKKEILKKALIISSISFLLIIYSNVNRPDAWLYHLPYSSIVNEYKIILGAANIHERFAHISIFQYVSSFFYNYLFLFNGIVIPISLVASFFFLFTYIEFKKNFFINSTTIYSYINFLILCLSLYAFNRYSEYGNDAQSHFFYFFFTIILFKYLLINKGTDSIKELFFISIFIFFIKPTFVVVLLIPLFLFINLKQRKKVLNSLSFLFFSLFLIIWILKNILTTGCLLYPLNFTCNNNILWKVDNLNQHTLINEAWSKGWPDQHKSKILDKSEFIKDFNWVKTWSDNHFLFILEKVLPILIFFIINFLLFYLTKSLKKNVYNENFTYLFGFSFCFLLLWFLKFPVYRLGISQIFIFFILSFYLIYIQRLNPKKILSFFNYFRYFIFFIVVIVLSKNFIRIYDDKFNTLMPNIFYSGKKNEKIFEVYNKENILTHYKTMNDDMCGYSRSPCVHHNREFLIKEFFGYKVYIIK
jgi:hypothetical protein